MHLYELKDTYVIECMVRDISYVSNMTAVIAVKIIKLRLPSTCR